MLQFCHSYRITPSTEQRPSRNSVSSICDVCMYKPIFTYIILTVCWRNSEVFLWDRIAINTQITKFQKIYFFSKIRGWVCFAKFCTVTQNTVTQNTVTQNTVRYLKLHLLLYCAQFVRLFLSVILIRSIKGNLAIWWLSNKNIIRRSTTLHSHWLLGSLLMPSLLVGITDFCIKDRCTGEYDGR